MIPYSWSTIGYMGHNGLTAAKGRIFAYATYPDFALVAKNQEIHDNAYVRLGAEPTALGLIHKLNRDWLAAFEATTGKTLWIWRSESLHDNKQARAGKGSRASVPAVIGDILVVRAISGTYGIAAASGEQLWHRDKSVFRLHHGKVNSDVSPVIARGLAILVDSHTGNLIALDPADGSERWRTNAVAAIRAIPSVVILDEKEYLLCATAKMGKNTLPEKTRLIDPSDGSVLWVSDVFGYTNAPLVVSGNIVLGNGIRGAKKDKDHRVAAARVRLKGLEKLWQRDEVHFPSDRHMVIADSSHCNIDSRDTGLHCLDLATGATVRREPHIYRTGHCSHNWTWMVATDDRVFTSAGRLYSNGASGFEALPGRLTIEPAGGYTQQAIPAVVDGVVFMRMQGSIAAFDLRKSKNHAVRQVVLQAKDVVPGQPDDKNDLTLILRDNGRTAATIAAEWSPLVHASLRPNAWLFDDSHAQQRSVALTPGFTFEADRISGDTDLRLSYNREHWTLEARKGPDGWTGTWTRRAKPLATVWKPSGTIHGRIIKPGPEQGRLVNLALEKGIAGTPLQHQAPDQYCDIALHLVNGKIASAYAYSGKSNTKPWEVDPSGLAVEGDRIHGSVIVIIRNDQYKPVNPDGGATAAKYEIDITIDGANFQGTYTGQVGIPWERSGPIRSP